MGLGNKVKYRCQLVIQYYIQETLKYHQENRAKWQYTRLT